MDKTKMKFHWRSRGFQAWLLSALFLLLAPLTGINLASERPPNIVILLADDLGYGELGCQGNMEIPTPNIDAIAANGVRCTAGYVTAPNCSPSRAGLLTGRTPTRFGYEFNPTGAKNEEPEFGLPPDEITIAETLQAAGYTTGLIGKWHQGGSAKFHPFRHGLTSFLVSPMRGTISYRRLIAASQPCCVERPFRVAAKVVGMATAA